MAAHWSEFVVHSYIQCFSQILGPNFYLVSNLAVFMAAHWPEFVLHSYLQVMLESKKQPHY